MNILHYFLILYIVISIFYLIFLILLNKKINKLEDIILNLFKKRTNLVPILHEITKEYLNKHSEVFNEIIKLRKIELSNYNDSFLDKVQNEILIHHELNFIFKVVSKHKKLSKNSKFLLTKDLFLENSEKLWAKILLYKNIVNIFNRLLIFKNITIIWIVLNIKNKNEI